MLKKAAILITTTLMVVTLIAIVVSYGGRRPFGWYNDDLLMRREVVSIKPSLLPQFHLGVARGRLWAYNVRFAVASDMPHDMSSRIRFNCGVVRIESAVFPNELLAEQLIFCCDILLWPMLVLFAAYPTITFIRGPLRRWRRRRTRWSRWRKSLCLECGYDLTGNSSGTCPECGTPVEERPQL